MCVGFSLFEQAAERLLEEAVYEVQCVEEAEDGDGVARSIFNSEFVEGCQCDRRTAQNLNTKSCRSLYSPPATPRIVEIIV